MKMKTAEEDDLTAILRKHGMQAVPLCIEAKDRHGAATTWELRAILPSLEDDGVCPWGEMVRLGLERVSDYDFERLQRLVLFDEVGVRRDEAVAHHQRRVDDL